MLEIRNLHKSYPDGWTLSDVAITVGEAEIVAFLGPSGCGKTTLLRLIAGLENPDRGEVLMDGEEVTQTPPHQRDFGLMFQEFALFPHKDVFDNVAFGLRMEDREPEAVRSRVVEILEVVGLTGFEHRDVNQLSGGERQRVALARSLAPEPRLLMLDEPLGALDRTLRERLLEELPSILKRVGVTTITVTHDQEEAFAIADRVALMRAGRVVQQGTPEQVYCKPASLWAARFLGLTNLLTASVVSESIVETPLGRLRVDNLKEELSGTRGTLLVRPEAARLEEGGQLNRITAQLTSQTFRGSRYQFGLRLKTGIEFEFERPSGREMPAMGEQVTLWLDPEGLVFLRG